MRLAKQKVSRKKAKRKVVRKKAKRKVVRKKAKRKVVRKKAKRKVVRKKAKRKVSRKRSVNPTGISTYLIAGIADRSGATLYYFTGAGFDSSVSKAALYKGNYQANAVLKYIKNSLPVTLRVIGVFPSRQPAISIRNELKSTLLDY